MTIFDFYQDFRQIGGGTVQDVVVVVNIGDSIAAAGGAELTSPDLNAGAHSRALIAYNSPVARSIQPLAHISGSRLGWWSHGPSFAQRLYELTGLGTLWITDLPQGGLSLRYEDNNAGNWDFRGTPSALTGNRLFLMDGSINLDTVLPNTLNMIANGFPGFRVVHKHLHYLDGGTELAAAYEAGTVTDAEVIAAHVAMIDYFEDNWGFDKMFVAPCGFVGDDLVDLAADTRRFDLARAAQEAAIAADPRIFLGFGPGEAYGTLVTDGDGRWVSGWTKPDSSHPGPDEMVCLGIEFAHATAAAL